MSLFPWQQFWKLSKTGENWFFLSYKNEIFKKLKNKKNDLTFRVVGATLVEWSESLKICVASSLGHAESIFHKKTICLRTEFWNNHDWIIHCSYGKTDILACVYVIF